MTTAHDSGNRDTLITGDELARMPDHDLTELIDGRIVPLSPTHSEHGRLEANISRALGNFVSAQNLGIVLVGEVGIFTRWNPDRVRGRLAVRQT
jgi:Uma2 family endonuclease